MKDNYSWLDDLLASVDDLLRREGWKNLNEEKQTIISQIEIEKLRARIDELKALEGIGIDTVLARRIFDLTEKLKELEEISI